MENLHCKKANCDGSIANGVCQLCGAPADIPDPLASSGKQAIIATMRELMDDKTPTGKDGLLKAAEKFESLVPDDYASWRLQANLLLSAVKQLELRQIEADETVMLIGVPMTEVNLRHACEKALRNCAHFAQSFEDRVALIDEANKVRQRTWF